MGSYNVKCGLTGMDITAGDKVVLLLGVRPGSPEYCGGWTGQPHFFQLLATPIFGSYNDYGWIEDVEEASWNTALACLDITLKGKVSFKDLDEESLQEKFLEHSWDASKKGKDENCLAWVLREAWDNFIKATDKANIRDSFNTLDTTGSFKVEDLMAYMEKLKITTEGSSFYDNRYKGKDFHWLSMQANEVQRFKVCDWIQKHCSCGDTEEDLRRENPGISEKFLSILRQAARDDHSSPTEFVLHEKLSWFFKGPYKAYELLALCDLDQTYFKASAAMFEGLKGGRIIIRPNFTMPLAGQGNDPHSDHAFLSIAKTIKKISMERIKETAEMEL